MDSRRVHDNIRTIHDGIAGKTLGKRHEMKGPQGVRGRNSDNTRLRQVLGWEPSVSLEDGLAVTYPWIESQLVRQSPLSAIV